MLIALDYDKTYNADKDFFDSFIELAEHAGHEVVIVTVRHRELDWHPDFARLQDGFGIELYFTDGWPKKKFMENEGRVVDIWIDDNPSAIVNGGIWSPNSPELALWREENKKNGT